MSEPSVFSKVISRELPGTVRYEDDEFIAFDDIHPAAPIHVLVVPKQEIPTLEDVSAQDDHFHARLLQIARQVAKQMGIQDNYKLVMNVGRGVQMVHHIHLHVMGGWKTPTPTSTPML